MDIHPVSQNDFAAAINLLKQNNLPTEDITETTKLFALYDEGRLIGTIGIETDGKAGLLRSLCIDEAKRKAGSGQQLVAFIEGYAKEQGVDNLYLLTTTAAPFFAARQYQTINRAEVPEAMQRTSEFASVCPSTATVMKKALV